MANVLTNNIYSCDSLGIISVKPIWVKAINFIANAVDDAFQMLYWVEDETIDNFQVTYSIATSTDDTITSTGNFPNTWLDGAVVKIGNTTGSDKGVYGLIKTAGNNNAIVVHLSPFTAENSKVGDFYQFATYNAFKGKMTKAADTEYSMWFAFPGERGFRFPNLALDSLSASAEVDIYLG